MAIIIDVVEVLLFLFFLWRGKRRGFIKTFAGILEMVKEGKIKQGENVIMLHTGGIPGIYTKHHRVEMEKELGEYIHII